MKKIKLFLVCLLAVSLISLNNRTVNAEQKFDQKTQKIIDNLGITNEKIEKKNEISSFSYRSNDTTKKTTKYTINDTSELEISKNGDLINLNRTSELSPEDSNKTLNYYDKNTILNNIYQIIPKDFILKEEQEFLDGNGTKFVFSKNNDNIENKYNVIIVSVENVTNKIITYKKIEEHNGKIQNSIDKNEAIEISNKYLKNKNIFSDYVGITLTIDKISDSEPLPIYKVKYNDKFEVWVDAIKGNVLLINGEKRKDSNSFYISNTFEPENAVNLQEILSILGYNTKTESFSISGVKNFLKGYHSYGFTFSGHGTQNTLGNKTGDDITPNHVAGNWNFVFLDACETALSNEWSNAFKIYNNSNNKIFLGWYESVGMLESNKFCKYLNRAVKNSSNSKFYSNVWEAINSSDDYFPIRFRGDESWNGKI